MTDNRTLFIVAGIVAGILQLVLAPAVTIAGCTPNFMVVAAIVLIGVNAETEHYVFAFTMGLVSDLITGMPLGSASLALLACAYVIPLAVETVGNDTIFMRALLVLGAVFVYQLASGILLSVAGLLGPIDAIIYYILPGTIYNGVLAIAFNLIASGRFTSKGSRSGATMTNVRFN